MEQRLMESLKERMAMVRLNEHEYRIVNVVKGKFGLKNISKAVSLIIDEYGEKLLEPELRPEYVKKLEEIRRGKYTRFDSIDELRRATSPKA